MQQNSAEGDSSKGKQVMTSLRGRLWMWHAWDCWHDSAWNHQAHDPPEPLVVGGYRKDYENTLEERCMEIQDLLGGLWGDKEVLHQCTESL